jgi:tellurite resistance protein TehA-like permease
MTELPAVSSAPRSIRTLTLVSLIFVVISPLVGLILATIDWARSRRGGGDKRATIISLCLNGVGFIVTLILAFLLPWLTMMVATRGSGHPIPNPFEYSAAFWSLIFGG